MKRLFLVILAIAAIRAEAEPLRFVTESFAPFNYVANGAVAGPGVEVAAAICLKLSIECSFVSLPLRRALDQVETGQADAMFSLARTPEREATMRLTRPYIRTGYAFFTLKDKNYSAANLRDLAGFTVAAYGPSGTYSNLEAAQRLVPSLHPVEEVSFDTPFRKLLAGHYPEPSAVYANWHVGLLWLKQHGIDRIVVTFPDKIVEYCYAFSRKSAAADAAFDQFDAALGELRQSGELLAILRRSDFSDSDLPADR
jgi:polar amino acid transport system substrate-binding protein